jgi:hypothetical protein
VGDQACYVASRILDFSRTAVSSGRRIRGLALVDMLLYPDLEYLLGLLRQDITDEI